MQVIVFSKKIKTKDIPYVQELFDILAEYQIYAYVYKPYFEQIQGKINFKTDVGIFEGNIDFSVKKDLSVPQLSFFVLTSTLKLYSSKQIIQ